MTSRLLVPSGSLQIRDFGEQSLGSIRIGRLKFQGKRVERWAEIGIQLYGPLKAFLLAGTIFRQTDPQPVPRMGIARVEARNGLKVEDCL